jgi:hypothetical protein
MAGEFGHQTLGKQSISLLRKGAYDTNRWNHRKGTAHCEEAQCNGDGSQAHHGQFRSRLQRRTPGSIFRVSEKAFFLTSDRDVKDTHDIYPNALRTYVGSFRLERQVRS